MSDGEDRGETPIEQLARLAIRIDSNALVATRPGQTADLEDIATQVRALVDRLRSWEGITALLDDRAREESKLRKELAAKDKALQDAETWLDDYRWGGSN